MANRNFNARQALEREIKELFLRTQFSATSGTAPTGTTSGLNAEITYTSATLGTTRNGDTITIQVAAAAANPTNTVLAVVTGTIDAVTITITPNDGTNNGATPVPLTTAELAELVTNGAVVGKTVTLTDASSLLDDLSATGGDATDLADGGEGDGVAATLSGGAIGNPTIVSGIGVASITKESAGTFTITLQDAYNELKSMSCVFLNSTAMDRTVQVSDNSIQTKSVEIKTKVAGTATDPVEDSELLIKLELRNSGSGE